LNFENMNELSEEEAIQAAMMARIAARAEQKAIEKERLLKLSQSLNIEKIVPIKKDDELLKPSYHSKEERGEVITNAKRARTISEGVDESENSNRNKRSLLDNGVSNFGKQSMQFAGDGTGSLSKTTTAKETKPSAASSSAIGNSKSSLFRFEWTASDDTMLADDVLYQQAASSLQKNKSTSKYDLGNEKQSSSKVSATSSSSSSLHWSEKPLDQMTERDWRIMKEDFNIRVRGGLALPPIRTWEEAGLDASILSAIREMKYKTPSPIQRQAIPMGIKQRDLIGIAETGSGKTAAFLIPALCYVLSLPKHVRESVSENGPLALVMAPTRELAQQIEQELVKLSKFTDITCACVVGGTSIAEQSLALRSGVDIVVGTPGRLIDSLENRYLVLHQCNYIVLDEADRMIDLGFEPQVATILQAMGNSSATRTLENDGPSPSNLVDQQQPSSGSSKRTTHMFSATFPPSIQRLASTYMVNPATVYIGDVDGSGKNARITQTVLYLPKGESQKKGKLMETLRRCMRPVIVFVNAKKQCDIVGRDLEYNGFSCAVLHGGKTQDIREDSLQEFKSGKVGILIATDVAGRGLDIPDVAVVINYDLPSEIDRYVHRIGRTGRAGKSGQAVSFFTDDDMPVLSALIAHLDATGQEVPNDLRQKATST
jgi:ATP-dependent RNA helicase DDX23/PRP28